MQGQRSSVQQDSELKPNNLVLSLQCLSPPPALCCKKCLTPWCSGQVFILGTSLEVREGWENLALSVRGRTLTAAGRSWGPSDQFGSPCSGLTSGEGDLE